MIKQRSAYTREKLETAREMTRRIVRHIDPNAVLLFGSVARGEAREASDVDLLVIGESSKSFKQRMTILYSEIERNDDIDMIWYTPGEVERMSRESSFVRRALREGTLLYERR